LAASAAFLLAAGACAPPQNTGNLVRVSPTSSASPSPSPTPTTAFTASGPGFHGGEVGIGYATVALVAGGGVQPYHWSVSAGALPPGLALDGDGKVSGSPTAAGNFAFTIEAADSGDSKAAIPGAIKVVPRLTAALLPACAQYCNVELGCANACGAFGSYTGGIAPYTFSVKQGPLPAGTALAPNALTLNGTFGGQTGYLQFTALVGDAYGATATVSPTFWMYPHVSLSGGTCLGRGGCQVTLSYSGGTPGQKVTAAPSGWVGDLKCGLGSVPQPCPQPSFSAAYQQGKVAITLTYQQGASATFGTLTVRLTSTDLCEPGAQCTSSATVTVVG
jgi:hypothetical protein